MPKEKNIKGIRLEVILIIIAVALFGIAIIVISVWMVFIETKTTVAKKDGVTSPKPTPTPDVQGILQAEWSKPFIHPPFVTCKHYAEKGAIAKVRINKDDRSIYQIDGDGIMTDLQGNIVDRVPRNVMYVEYMSAQYMGKSYWAVCRPER